MVSRFSFFTPRVMPNLASPVVSMMCGTKVVAGTWGLQLMSHFNRAKKKLKSINRMFRAREWVRRGIFLKSGGKRPVGWVKFPNYGGSRLRTSHPVLPWIGGDRPGLLHRPLVFSFGLRHRASTQPVTGWSWSGISSTQRNLKPISHVLTFALHHFEVIRRCPSQTTSLLLPLPPPC